MSHTAFYIFESMAVYSNSSGALIATGPSAGTLFQTTNNLLTAFGAFFEGEQTGIVGDPFSGDPLTGYWDSPIGRLPVIDDGTPGGATVVFSWDPTFDFPDTLPPVTTEGFSVCFAKGTMIDTLGGQRKVEELKIGDLVSTASGSSCAVIWIGRQTVSKLFSGPQIQPVRIRAGALGDGLPHNDLTVTADHGMVIDGLVINASALVNGTTIDWVPLADLPDRVTYYHIETEAHDVILANGAPSETFIDYVGRKAFDNYAEYLELYGAERIIREMPQPRISSARMLPEAIKARFGDVSTGMEGDARLRA